MCDKNRQLLSQSSNFKNLNLILKQQWVLDSKRTQTGNIHSIILDVHALKQSALNLLGWRVELNINFKPGGPCGAACKKSILKIQLFYSRIMRQQNALQLF